MISRVRRVSVAVVAALTTAAACYAAEPGGGPGQGGIGGQLGASTFRFDGWWGSNWFGDYSAGSQSRPVFHGHWRYQMNSHFRWEVAPGYTWAGYKGSTPMPFTDPRFPEDKTKGEMLTQFLSVSAELQYVLRHKQWLYYGGVGPGVYRVWVENRREVIKDPLTFNKHRGVYPGGSATFGVEHFLKSLPNTSLEGAMAGHLAFAQRDDQFPSGFNSNVMVVELRVGGNYYFTPGPRKAPAAPAKTP
jgi:hypothetical protein